jgi:hypothetical protein
MIETYDEPFWIEIRRNATVAACRKFGLTLLLGLPVAGVVWLLLLRATKGHWVPGVPVGFAVAAVLLGGSIALWPTAGRGPYIVWHVVVRAIELALTWLLLLVLFYLVIFPIGLLRRRGAGPFRGPQPGQKTYWQDVPPVKDPRRYYRQF